MSSPTDARADRFRRLLEAKRDEIRREGDLAITADEPREVVEKIDDDQAPLTEMTKVIASNRNRTRTQRLVEIQAALERLEEDPDEFGLCEGCEEEIPARRLDLVPWARLCIKCQEAREAGTDRGARRHLTDYK